MTPMRCAILVLTASAAASAQTAVNATVTVNVRSGPGTGYGILGTAQKGQRYVAFYKSGGWWRIWFDGRAGYTYGGYWTVTPGELGAKIDADILSVFSGPGTSYAIIGKTYRGQVYRPVETKSGWHRICHGGAYRWIPEWKTLGVVLQGGATSTVPTDLAVPYYKQTTGYYCGPATVQMGIQYVSGKYYTQDSLAAWMGTTTRGTVTSKTADAMRNFTGQPYQWVLYSRERVVANIQKRRPCPIPANMLYIQYAAQTVYHALLIKGYTSGGYVIHDSWWGPNSWASATEVYNSSNAWDPHVAAQY